VSSLPRRRFSTFTLTFLRSTFSQDPFGFASVLGELGLPSSGLAPVRGDFESPEAEEAFKAPIRDQYELKGHPYYSTARLWDDGVIDPAQTRDVLGLALGAVSEAPLADPAFGIFRM